MTMTRPRTFAATCKSMSLVGEIAAVWHDLAKALFDPYRPERHYMRGPGPAWHAKHGLPPRTFTARDATPALLRPIPALARARR
jgi:hypothetical protein